MDKEFLKKAISEQIGALSEQISMLVKHQNKIPQIELDITMTNMREIYEYLHALNKINQLSTGNGTAKVPPKEKVEAVPEPKPEKVKVDKPAVAKTPARVEEDVVAKTSAKVKEVIVPKKDVKVEEAVKAPAQPVAKAPPPKAEPKPAKKAATPVVKVEAIVEEPAKEKIELIVDTDKKSHFELFEETPKTLADKLKKKDEIRVADKFEQKVKSLKNAIGINDKFLFINDLFHGKLTDYNKAIKKMDEMPDASSCIEEFNMLTQQYEWDEESETFQKLSSFVHKKHQ